MQNIKKQKPPKLCKIKAETLTLNKEKGKIKFKVFAEDDLFWPVDSYLIQNINKVQPKHGGGNRISME